MEKSYFVAPHNVLSLVTTPATLMPHQYRSDSFEVIDGDKEKITGQNCSSLIFVFSSSVNQKVQIKTIKILEGCWNLEAIHFLFIETLANKSVCWYCYKLANCSSFAPIPIMTDHHADRDIHTTGLMISQILHLEPKFISLITEASKCQEFQVSSTLFGKVWSGWYC